MSRRLTLALLILLPLAACGRSDAPAQTVADTVDVASATSVAAVESPVPAATATLASASSSVAAGATTQVATNDSPVATTAPAVADPNAPRLGIDYTILPSPQPTYGEGKIEVAEVFSYACIHCAQFQPVVDAWLKKLPSDVRYEYVPAVFQQVWENFARAFFAAKALGVLERTHDAAFKAVHIEHSVKTPSPDGIADWYATQGVDRGKFLDTMNSFGVTAMVNRAKQFSLRTGVDGTPSIIVAGKYKVEVNAERGFEGMLATVDYLVARERSLSAAAPVAASKP